MAIPERPADLEAALAGRFAKRRFERGGFPREYKWQRAGENYLSVVCEKTCDAPCQSCVCVRVSEESVTWKHVCATPPTVWILTRKSEHSGRRGHGRNRNKFHRSSGYFRHPPPLRRRPLVLPTHRDASRRVASFRVLFVATDIDRSVTKSSYGTSLLRDGSTIAKTCHQLPLPRSPLRSLCR